MKPVLPPLQVVRPCPKRWSELEGDAKRRFCSECQLHVHNLSAMDKRERAEFIAGRGAHACISYALRADGSMVTPPRWAWLAATRGVAAALLAGALPFIFGGCAERRTTGAPVFNDKESGRLTGEAPTLTVGGVAPAPPGE
jgi:hypothetical protein